MAKVSIKPVLSKSNGRALPVERKQRPVRPNKRDDERRALDLTSRKSLVENLPEPIHAWMRDPRCLDFSRQVERLVGEGYQEQMQRVFDIQRKRIIRNSKLSYENLNDGQMRPVTESQIRDFRERSNITEMVMKVKEGSAALTDGLSLLRRHLKSQHAAEFKKLYGALTNVDAAIESHFDKAVEATKAAERFIDIANDVIKDIDQGAFTYDRLIKTANLVLGPRARQV